MFGFRVAGAAFLLAASASAHAGTCTGTSSDCDGDGVLNEVDLCPFTSSAGNTQTLVTYAGSTTRLPTGAECTHADVYVHPTALIGHGVELGSGATVFEFANIGNYSMLAGTGQAAVVGRKATLVDAPTPELGTVFAFGVIGG